MTMSFEFNEKKVKDKIDNKVNKVQVILDMQIAKDSNYYCPEDVGTLQDSVLLFSDMGSGELVWNTEYAKKQYYGFPDKATDKNPNAQMKWFEVAKTKNNKTWEKIANGEFNS